MREILPGRQLDALNQLLEGKTVPAVAESVGVHESTIRRWMKQPAFYAEMQARASELLDATTARLNQTMSNAPEIVNQIMMNDESPATVKLAAARIALDSGLRLLEARTQEARIQDALERLARLEEKQTEKRHDTDTSHVRTWNHTS